MNGESTRTKVSDEWFEKRLKDVRSIKKPKSETEELEDEKARKINVEKLENKKPKKILQRGQTLIIIIKL